MVSIDPLQLVFVFVLAAFVGFQLISRVPPVLHTPLMSATNAIHGIVFVGAIVAATTAPGSLAFGIALAATFLGAANVVGGFVVTDRMLEMFRTGPAARGQEHRG